MNNLILVDEAHEKKKNEAISIKHSHSGANLGSYDTPVPLKRRSEDHYDYEDFKSHRILLVAMIICGVFWVRSVYLVVSWFLG